MGPAAFWFGLAGLGLLGISATGLVLNWPTLLDRGFVGTALVNRVLRHVGVASMWWRIRGQWYNFRDEPGSLTPVIVAGEIRRGLYDVKFHPGEVVVDLGAHVGMFSIPLARENPLVKFVCYEPHPTTFANLVRNIKHAEVRNVEAINAGLAPKPCMLASENIQWNTGGQRSTPSDHGVPGLTIGQILALHRPTVLKVDVEGAEFGAIQGDDLASVECVIMEIHGHLGDPVPVLDAVRRAGGHMVQVIEDERHAGVYRDGIRWPAKTTFGPTALREVPA